MRQGAGIISAPCSSVPTAWAITMWRKSTADLVAGTPIRSQGYPSRGRIRGKPNIKAEKCLFQQRDYLQTGQKDFALSQLVEKVQHSWTFSTSCDLLKKQIRSPVTICFPSWGTPLGHTECLSGVLIIEEKWQNSFVVLCRMLIENEAKRAKIARYKQNCTSFVPERKS